MKLTIILLVITAFQVQAHEVHGKGISLDVKKTEIRKVLDAIERSGFCRFLYSYDLKGLKTKLILPQINCRWKKR